MQVFIKIISVLVLAITLASCTWANAFRSGIATRGEDAADQALESTIWAFCRATPVGAINRRFKTIDDIAAYRGICPNSMAVPIPEE